jgi:hypothetical protein
MRQFLKGRRLITLCEKKTQNAQRIKAQLATQCHELKEQISLCNAELHSLEQALVMLQIQEASVTKADIYHQRKQQAILLHRRAQITLEHTIAVENLEDVERDIKANQKYLAVLKRKEMKFSKWVQHGRKQWIGQQDSVAEDETQEVFPWAMKP